MSTAEDKAAEQLRKLTEEIEEEKKQKKKEREQRKKEKLAAQKRETREKWVAPVLLVVTALISLLLISLK